MPIEQEVLPMLIGGFSIVMGTAVLFTLFFWFKNKSLHAGYVWTLIHYLLFSGAVYFFLEAVAYRGTNTMVSEEISLRMGVAGVLWAISMMCLIIGIFYFSKLKGLRGNTVNR
jgi:hypothetical protein